ncbi:hypothetical protein ASF29_20205 [Rhizobium sp. Leaf262]|nr:hypothetical protein ASF29_20205 [Rhizobium sp. Leaf262]
MKPQRRILSEPIGHSAGYLAMKKTTRKPLNRMTLFVISIFILAVIVAAVYLIGFTPGETPIAQ